MRVISAVLRRFLEVVLCPCRSFLNQIVSIPKAPKQIRTAYRLRIEAELGWTPSSAQFPDQVEDIISNADKYHEGYYAVETFRGPSLHFHRRSLELHDSTDFERYLECIYATLTSWGMHRMGMRGSKMVPYDVFRESVEPLRDTIGEAAHLDWVDMTYDKWLLIERLFKGINIMASKTTIVGNSKVMAHMIPNMVPPIDRQYTLKYLRGSTYLRNNLDWEWGLMKEIISEFFIPIAADASFRRKADVWIADQSTYPWDTSVLKVIDNLVIAAGKS